MNPFDPRNNPLDRVNTGGPAFPCPATGGEPGEFGRDHDGLTLRDWFAAAALPAILPDADRVGHQMVRALAVRQDAAELAYLMADAMLAARRAARREGGAG